MLKSNFELEVLVNGHPAKEYYHKGSTYIEGKEGSKFSLRFKNNSWGKVLFVPTIDGLSVMDGESGSFSSRGYIVNSYDSITIEGWRVSDSKVAEFFFSSPKGSYAVKTDKGGNLGIIGAAIFKEKAPVQPSWTTFTTITPYQKLEDNFPVNTCYYSNASLSGNDIRIKSTSASASAYLSASSSLGTGFGQDKESPTVSVTFNREDSPTEIFTLYYDSRKNLERQGVEFKKPLYVAPSAFPAETGYCKRPRNN